MQVEIKRHQKCGMYVEFNISGDNKQYQHWAEDSLYLYEPICGVFVNQFESCAVRPKYYGPTLYEDEALRQLDIGLGTGVIGILNARRYHMSGLLISIFGLILSLLCCALIIIFIVQLRDQIA